MAYSSKGVDTRTGNRVEFNDVVPSYLVADDMYSTKVYGASYQYSTPAPLSSQAIYDTDGILYIHNDNLANFFNDRQVRVYDGTFNNLKPDGHGIYVGYSTNPNGYSSDIGYEINKYDKSISIYVRGDEYEAGIGIDIPVKPGNKLFVSFDTNSESYSYSCILDFYTKDGNHISSANSAAGDNGTVVPPGANWVILLFIADELTFKNISLNIGSRKDYVDAHSSIIKLPVLRGVKYKTSQQTRDIYEPCVFVDGEYRSRLSRYIRKIEITKGTAQYLDSVGKEYPCMYFRTSIERNAATRIMCTHDVYTASVTIYGTNHGIWPNTNQALADYMYWGIPYEVLGTTSSSTVSENLKAFNNYLAARKAEGNPVCVYYALKEPDIEYGDPIFIRNNKDFIAELPFDNNADVSCSAIIHR